MMQCHVVDSTWCAMQLAEARRQAAELNSSPAAIKKAAAEADLRKAEADKAKITAAQVLSQRSPALH